MRIDNIAKIAQVTRLMETAPRETAPRETAPRETGPTETGSGPHPARAA
jgi:hypothetical protein